MPNDIKKELTGIFDKMSDDVDNIKKAGEGLRDTAENLEKITRQMLAYKSSTESLIKPKNDNPVVQKMNEVYQELQNKVAQQIQINNELKQSLNNAKNQINGMTAKEPPASRGPKR